MMTLSLAALGRFLAFTIGFAAMICGGAVAAIERTDHALIGGLSGFNIREKTEKPFDVVQLDLREIAQVPNEKYAGPLKFEGRVTQFVYSTKPGVKSSAVEIYRNYVDAVKKVGGKQLNAPPDGKYADRKHVFQLPRAGGQAPALVILYITYDFEYYLTVVEPQAMTQSVKAGDMAREIAADGWATLYINFDTNKSELKEDGEAAVKEIATLLKQQPTLRLSIEGHTDNVGDTQANRKLSQARAEAVLAAVKAQGIDAKRLAAKGQGADIPIADNRKEDGRAKNRRVELVKLP
jgi:OOP family OmpA-OmpF porin